MNEIEREVERATQRFYDAIEAIVSGGGAEAMNEAWHHTDTVTSRHPIEGWSTGWDQNWETWKFVATFGRQDRGGGKVLELTPHVYGDIAYCTVVFQAAPAWGGAVIMCTNILLKKDGVWKVIHHHADPSPEMQAALEKMVEDQ